MMNMPERNTMAAVTNMLDLKNHVIFLFGKQKSNTTILSNANVGNYVKKSMLVVKISYQFSSLYASTDLISTIKVAMFF